MNITWTKRGQKRFNSCSAYISENFYPDYAANWEEAVAQTVERLPDNPELGREAFPEINRPELRKILCDHYHYWIFYRTKKDLIEILSVRHCLMNIDSPRKL